MIVQQLKVFISELASRALLYASYNPRFIDRTHSNLSIAPTQNQITNSDFIAFRHIAKSLVSASGAILKTKAKVHDQVYFQIIFE